MRIDDNAEALAMMRRALGSLEGKFREAYNKGYQDGVKSMVAEDEPQKKWATEWCEDCSLRREDKCMGVAQCKANMEAFDRLLMEIYTEEPCIDIETGILHWCGWEYKRIDDEPQTERSE